MEAVESKGKKQMKKSIQQDSITVKLADYAEAIA
jgi:hypothetical protein